MCLVWGTTWLAIKIGGHGLPPLTGVGLRFLIAGTFLYALAGLRRQIRPFREVPWHLVGVFASLLCGLNYVLIYIAETRIDSGVAAVLFGTLPFFVFLFARFMANERASVRVWIGGVAAFTGVALLCLKGGVAASPLYALAVVGSAAAAAFANVYAKRHHVHAPLVTLPPAMLAAGAVEFAMGLSIERTDWHAAIAPASIAALLYLALLGSGITFLLLMWLMQRLPATIVGLSPLTYPPIAIAAGALLGGEHVTVRELGGAALVLIGLGIALLPAGKLQRVMRRREECQPTSVTAKASRVAGASR